MQKLLVRAGSKQSRKAQLLGYHQFKCGCYCRQHLVYSEPTLLILFAKFGSVGVQPDEELDLAGVIAYV